MSPLPCSDCCEDCTVAEDNFDRANNTNISTGSTTSWTEVAGDWSIASNQLSVAAANAFALCNTSHPNSIASCVVSVRITLAADGDKAAVRVNYTDANNYHFVVFEAGVDGCAQLWKRAAGVETMLASIPTIPVVGGYIQAGVPADVTVYCSYSESIFVAASNGGRVRAADFSGVTANGAKVGLATVGTPSAAVKFDNFKFEKYRTESAPTCRATGRCEAWRDEFNGRSLGDPGCAWENNGTSLVAGGLSCPDDTSAKFLQPIPTSHAMFVRVLAGESCLVYLGITDDNNYFYARVEAILNDVFLGQARYYAEFSLHQVVDGVDTELTACVTPKVLVFGFDPTREFWLDESRFTVRALNRCATAEITLPVGGPAYAAVGDGFYYDFNLVRLEDSDDPQSTDCGNAPSCEGCTPPPCSGGPCEQECAPLCDTGTCKMRCGAEAYPCENDDPPFTLTDVLGMGPPITFNCTLECDGGTNTWVATPLGCGLEACCASACVCTHIDNGAGQYSTPGNYVAGGACNGPGQPGAGSIAAGTCNFFGTGAGACSVATTWVETEACADGACVEGDCLVSGVYRHGDACGSATGGIEVILGPDGQADGACSGIDGLIAILTPCDDDDCECLRDSDSAAEGDACQTTDTMDASCQ